jgi:hypothetical protein
MLNVCSILGQRCSKYDKAVAKLLKVAKEVQVYDGECQIYTEDYDLVEAIKELETLQKASESK